MTTALVSRDRLFDGDLPRLCIKTGQPADGTVSVRFSSLPPWTFLLLLAGVVPFLIAMVFATERIRGEVPVRREVIERFHTLGRWGWWLILAAAVIGIAAIWLGEPWLGWVAAVGVAAGVVMFVRRDMGWVDARPVRDTPFVELRRVSPEFAAAAEKARKSTS